MATVAPLDTDWRDAMTRDDRIKVCQHIMQKLSTYYQMVPEQALREKTSAFESQAYTHAESRTDYLRRIAGGLSNVERQVTATACDTYRAPFLSDLTAMATIAPPDTDWRYVMTGEDRIKVCRNIMQKLILFYRMVPEQTLREKTSAFESQTYTHAESHTDYLRRIADGLSRVERQFTATATATAPNV